MTVRRRPGGGRNEAVLRLVLAVPRHVLAVRRHVLAARRLVPAALRLVLAIPRLAMAVWRLEIVKREARRVHHKRRSSPPREKPRVRRLEKPESAGQRRPSPPARDARVRHISTKETAPQKREDQDLQSVFTGDENSAVGFFLGRHLERFFCFTLVANTCRHTSFCYDLVKRCKIAVLLRLRFCCGGYFVCFGFVCVEQHTCWSPVWWQRSSYGSLTRSTRSHRDTRMTMSTRTTRSLAYWPVGGSRLAGRRHVMAVRRHVLALNDGTGGPTGGPGGSRTGRPQAHVLAGRIRLVRPRGPHHYCWWNSQISSSSWWPYGQQVRASEPPAGVRRTRMA
jgi:hypothetical protein